MATRQGWRGSMRVVAMALAGCAGDPLEGTGAGTGGGATDSGASTTEGGETLTSTDGGSTSTTGDPTGTETTGSASSDGGDGSTSSGSVGTSSSGDESSGTGDGSGTESSTGSTGTDASSSDSGSTTAECSAQAPGSMACANCLETMCCESLEACLAEPLCVCWLDCSRFGQPADDCATECGGATPGELGPLTECMNGCDGCPPP